MYLESTHMQWLSSFHRWAAWSWCRSSLVGYVLAFPLSALAILIPTFERSLTPTTNFFTGALSFLVTLLVGTVWGAGPTLLTIVLCVLGLDYFVVPPTGTIDFYSWPDFLFFGPFLFAQFSVLLLVILRERDHRRILQAEKETRQYAQTVSELNQVLVESNDKLVEADRLKDQFLSQASHELKTPITMIRGWAEYALRQPKKRGSANVSAVSVVPHLERIETLTHTMTLLVSDLMDVSSLMNGRLPLRLTRVDLVALCQHVVEEQSLFSGRCFKERYSPAYLFLQADEARIMQVVNNLVTNAIKYSASETTIQVIVGRELDSALLKVHNEGHTIPQEQQNDLFEPFYRTPDARISPKEGWGLGLAICKQIVERHQGCIWVESLAGKGTTFFVKLPLRVENDSSTNA